MIVTASSASSFEPRKPASAVTKIKKGNSEVRIVNAIWLARAQPSSPLKWRKAS
jgi:hypothetical protein